MIGYREFRVCDDGLLQGLFLQVWETREMEARCLCDLAVVSTPVDATAPVDQPPHACGIYLQRYPVRPTPGYVGAACVGSGKVVAHGGVASTTLPHRAAHPAPTPRRRPARRRA
jgi:hypothetical protein